VVLKGKLRNQDVAVKIRKRQSPQKRTISWQMTEIEFLRKLNGDDNILQCFGLNSEAISQGYIFVFLEFCELGSAEKYLRANKEVFANALHIENLQTNPRDNKDVLQEENLKSVNFSTRNLLIWTHQVSQGMEYVAANKVSILLVITA